MSFGVGHRLRSDPTLLWLWRRQVAKAAIHLLALELPYAMGVALKSQKKKKKEKIENLILTFTVFLYFRTYAKL